MKKMLPILALFAALVLTPATQAHHGGGVGEAFAFQHHHNNNALRFLFGPRIVQNQFYAPPAAAFFQSPAYFPQQQGFSSASFYSQQSMGFIPSQGFVPSQGFQGQCLQGLNGLPNCNGGAANALMRQLRGW